MSLSWDDVRQGIEDARQTITNGDSHINKMASIIEGRLKSCKVSSGTLRKLKRELRDFNMITGKWKD